MRGSCVYKINKQFSTLAGEPCLVLGQDVLRKLPLLFTIIPASLSQNYARCSSAISDLKHISTPLSLAYPCMHTATFTQHSGVFRGNLNRTAIDNRQDRLSAMLTECLERVVYITNGFHFLYLLDLFKANINLCKKLKSQLLTQRSLY